MTLNPKRKSVSNWELLHFRGGMIAEGIRGGLTGKGYSMLICDDLVKNWEEAASPLINDGIWKELQACALSGADYPYSVQLVIGTRWAKDDRATFGVAAGRVVRADDASHRRGRYRDTAWRRGDLSAG